MSKTRKEQMDKKSAILVAALDLFVKQGYHSTSTASIAKAAGVATGTLFHHYPSKDAIMNSLFLNIKQEFADYIMQHSLTHDDLEKYTYNVWNKAIDWAIENPLKQLFFLKFSLSSALSPDVRQQGMNTILHIIVDIVQRGREQQIIADYPIDLLLENCHGQYLASIRFFTDNPHLGHDEIYRQASFQMIWRSIKA